MNTYKKQAFTLVELIVVVTILAILATIWFVSYSSYLIWVRDTNRISQLTNLSNWLNLFSAKSSLPLPDNNIEVSVDWESIAYQGTAWANTLETINFNKWWKDPKDGTYFSYYLTNDRKHFQLLSFLEEDSTIAFSSSLFSKSHATNYSERVTLTSGKAMWILTDDQNVPIEQLSSDLDITSATSWYRAHFGSSFYWEDASLINLLAVSREWWYKQSLLVWLDMETELWGEIYDLSGNGNNAEMVGSSITVWDSAGVLGQSTDYTHLWGHLVPFFSELQDSDSLTVSVWSKTDSQSYAYNTLVNQWDCTWWCASSWDFTWNLWETNASSYGGNNVVLILWADWLPTSERVYPQPMLPIYGTSVWSHFAVTKSPRNIKLYVNWKLVDSVSSDTIHMNSALPLYVGNSWHTAAYDTNSWQIDDLRIYGAELNQDSIKNIYNAGKKDL